MNVAGDIIFRLIICVLTKGGIAILTVKSRNLNSLGVLDNAYNISVTRRTNALWTAQFSLPADDPKNALCSHMNFVEIIAPNSGRYLGLYRISPTETRKSIDADRITYELEHVFATLMDDVIDGVMPSLINRTTRDNLNRLLALQETKHWRLGDVDFERFFEYSFENENGLLAPILSIPQPFDEPFEFTYDTQNYPWTLNLVKPSEDVRAEIRWGKDMISFDEVSDPTGIVNYLIPKGYGEGVNQLTIEDANGGVRYLKDDASIAEWGRRSYIWIDRRFKHAGELKGSAQSLLTEWKHPKIAFEVDSVDLSILPEYAHEQKHLNGIVRIIVENKTHYGRILEEKIANLDKEYDVSYKIANRINDIATIQADVERKQQVNEAYSQGATNILNFTYQDNADSGVPANIPFYIDDDVVHVNTIELTFQTKRFRAYSRATEGGGGTTESTTSGGGTTRSTTSGGSSTQTSSSGGGTSTSTNSGGGSSQTSAAGGDHRHKMFVYAGNVQGAPARGRFATYNGFVDLDSEVFADLYTQGSSGTHSHSVSIPAHSHSFTVNNHTHSITIPAHDHSVTIPAHSHSVTIPNHIHEVKHEIVEMSATPSRVTIKVDGNVVPYTSTSAERLNIVEYLAKDSDGKVTRGKHEVEILPNGLARIEADLILRVFIQSSLGGNY